MLHRLFQSVNIGLGGFGTRNGKMGAAMLAANLLANVYGIHGPGGRA
jgi:hypothetical protein